MRLMVIASPCRTSALLIRSVAAGLAAVCLMGLEASEVAAADKPSEELLFLELDKRRPDEHSPFFALREEAAFYATEAGQRMADRNRVAAFPNTAKGASVGQTVTSFWRDVSKPFRRSERRPGKMVSLGVRPGPDFSLDELREITVAFELANNTNRLIALEFETTQRVDFVIEDEEGVEVARWSRDREFVEMPGVVMVNPDEKVIYTGTLPTRDLQSGRTYTLRAEITGHAEYSQSIALRPRGSEIASGAQNEGEAPSN